MLGVLTPLYTNAIRVSVLQCFLIDLHFVLQLFGNQFFLWLLSHSDVELYRTIRWLAVVDTYVDHSALLSLPTRSVDHEVDLVWQFTLLFVRCQPVEGWVSVLRVGRELAKPLCIELVLGLVVKEVRICILESATVDDLVRLVVISESDGFSKHLRHEVHVWEFGDDMARNISNCIHMLAFGLTRVFLRAYVDLNVLLHRHIEQ